MEQRRIEGKSHWYHETQSSASRAHALPLVPEAATVNDPFLLDLALPEKQKTDLEGIVSPARKIYALLFPQRVNTSRLRTFSAYDRLSTALTAAQVFGVQRLCNHYAARLAPLSGPDSSRESNYRLAQITQHARQLAASPSVIDARARQQLEDVGLTFYDLVIINQIIGFVAFQARVVAILQASLGQQVRFIPGMETQQEADAALFSDTATEWQPGIDSVDLRTANAPQMESLARWQPLPELRLLAPLLAHEHLLLNELGEMSEQVAKISPNKQQSWLVAAYTARLNGSTSCFTQRVQRGTDDELLTQALRAGSRELNRVLAGKNKESALVQAVQTLTCSPDRFSPAQFLQLEEHGYSRQAAISLLVACALNGWLNRLHIALGQSVS
ncbi:CMD domain-containing protein [Kosakonia sp. R1.Fl]|uniref:CMD domain-containing protein n=1 Tax=Kosakonia sp. R1.Fl TaxID=2928706 RepID=UPI00201E01F9|nr:CMD domain-containing protein [Kosakonia sp. R1.Fl]MCL6745526.1 CMD domain-containing protein [Kosakonia sp. R1.Fl]